jgi:transcriptional regulator with XRE-family HTH domain
MLPICQGFDQMQNVTAIIRKVTDDPIISLLENALIAWRTKQTKLKGNVSLNAFAEVIGASRPLVSMWMNGERPVTLNYRKKIAKPIADLVGSSAYEILDVTPPNPYLQKIIGVFENLSDEHQRKLAEDAELYKVTNHEEHVQRTSRQRKKRNAD